MIEYFSGPRQIAGSSREASRKPMDITFTVLLNSIGARAPSRRSGRASCKPSMIGTLGPWMSTSSRPTLNPRLPSATARLTATVLLPTPPLPERTTI